MDAFITHYEKHDSAIRFIRNSVFVIEQNIPLELEMDHLDSQCMHAIVFDQKKPIAVGRIDLSEQGKISRVAVLQEHRRQGAGRLVIQTLEQFAVEHQAEKVWFHAQKSSIPFYIRLGYKIVSEEFLEADIVHQKMEKFLLPASDTR